MGFLEADTHLSQDLTTWGPAQPLCQAIEEPESSEDRHCRTPGKDYVDQANQEQPRREEPTSTHLVRQYPTHKLANGIGCRLAAGDEPCRGQEQGTENLGLRGQGRGTGGVGDMWDQVGRGAGQGKTASFQEEQEDLCCNPETCAWTLLLLLTYHQP